MFQSFRKILIVIGIVLVNSMFAFSYTINKDSQSVESKHSFKFTTQIGNNVIQNGRKQATNQLYVRPSLMYYHIKGFYIGTYITTVPSNKKNRLDNIRWNTGYDYDIGDHLSLGIDYSYSQYFTTNQVTSSAPHCIMLSATWYGNIITPSIYEIFNLGSTNDFTTNIDFSHVFVKRNFLHSKGKLSIPLNIGTFYGSSNYYNNYAKNNKLTDKKGNPLPLNSLSTTANEFTGFYVSLTLKYKISNFAVSSNVTMNNQLEQKKYVIQTPVWKIMLAYYL